jgi:predicted dehydrogenase
MNKYRVGVAGLGFIGAAHIDALRRVENAEVAALADVVGVEEKAKQLHIPQAYCDYRDMIDSGDIDAVHICTPNDTHFEIAMYAMEKGLHVVCEKPFMHTIEEAVTAVKTAKEKGVAGAVNYHNRFYPAPNHLKNLVRDGELGDIISVNGGYVQDWLLYDTDFNWRLLSKNSGKTMVVADIGSHWINLVEFITGLKITEVFAEFSCVYPERKRALPSGGYEPVKIDTEQIAYITLRFENGAIGSGVFSTMVAGKKNKTFLTVSGKKMMGEWDSECINDLLLGRRAGGNIILTKDPGLAHPDTKPIIAYPGGHAEGFPDAFRQHFKQFYQSIGNPGLQTYYATFEDGLRDMRICDGIYESAHSGKWVKIQ